MTETAQKNVADIVTETEENNVPEKATAQTDTQETEENKVTDKEGDISTSKGIEKLTYEKDGEGHVLTQTAPDGSKKTYTYDKVGRVMTETDETGSTVSYEYNKMIPGSKAPYSTLKSSYIL